MDEQDIEVVARTVSELVNRANGAMAKDLAAWVNDIVKQVEGLKARVDDLETRAGRTREAEQGAERDDDHDYRAWVVQEARRLGVKPSELVADK